MFANKYLFSWKRIYWKNYNLDILTSLEVKLSLCASYYAMLQMLSNKRCFTLSHLFSLFNSVSFHFTISLSVFCTAWALCALLSRNTSLWSLVIDWALTFHVTLPLIFLHSTSPVSQWRFVFELQPRHYFLFIFFLLFTVIFQSSKTQSHITTSKAENAVHLQSLLCNSFEASVC